MSSANNACPSVKLPSGASMPMVGLGTWQSAPGEVKAAVEAAIKAGYRHIDGAFLYMNEVEVGEGLKACIDEGVCKREDVFMVSKLWCCHFEEAERACRKTLSDLGLDYLDLYLVHWPTAVAKGDDPFPKNPDGSINFSDVALMDTWRQMEKLVEMGLVKDIGISNFNSAQVKEIVDNCKILPATNQVECHPSLNQEKLRAFCEERGIVLTAYSPLGSPGLVTAMNEGTSAIPMNGARPNLLGDPKVKEIAAKHGKTTAQVLLRFQIQRGVVVVPKSVTPKRIQENYDILDFELTKEDMDFVNSLECNGRIIIPAMLEGHPQFPFKIPF